MPEGENLLIYDDCIKFVKFLRYVVQEAGYRDHLLNVSIFISMTYHIIFLYSMKQDIL